MGNEVQNSATTHVTRIWWAFKGVYSHNYISGSSLNGNGRHALKMHASAYWPDPNNNDPSLASYVGTYAETGGGGLPEFTRFVVISNNIFGSSGPWPVAIGPQDAWKDERVSDVIFEKNWYTQEYGSQSNLVQIALYFASSYSTIRNNIFDLTSGANGTTGISILRRGFEPAPKGNNIYNNTIYRGEDLSTTTNPHYGIAIHAEATDTVVKNNVVSYSFISSPTLIVLDDNSGQTVSSNNILTPFTDLADPENAPPPLSRDFSLDPAASNLIDSGETLPVFDDLDGTIRTGLFDIGAYSY